MCEAFPLPESTVKTLFLALLLAAGTAHADDCTIDVKGDDMMKFDKTEVTVSAACKTITLKLAHTGKLAANAMGHNLVVSPTESYVAVATDGMNAGLPNNYVPPNDARVLGYTKVVGGGESATATMPGAKLKAGGAYTFFCSFPGHYSIMKGTLIVK
jgi:azurin